MPRHGHGIVVVVVSRMSRHRQDRAHRAARSPSLDWHARSRNASDPATSVSSNKGDRDGNGGEGRGSEERGDRRENKKRERIECAPAKAVAVGGEEERAGGKRIVKDKEKEKDR